MFYNLYQNIILIKEIYNKIIIDKTIKDYLQVYESNILDIDEYCHNILTFINDNIEIELAKDIDNIQNFEVNFIKKGVDNELDIKTKLLNESELKLEYI
jgi:hypothetical protein